MNDFEKHGILDEITPTHNPLSAKFKRSFAYYTIQQRLPIILTRVIDQITRDKDEIADEFCGEVTKEDIKDVIANVSELKYELQTNKDLQPLHGEEADKDIWNGFIEQLDHSRSFFSTRWLYAECYMYRRLKSIFEMTQSLKEYDYFHKQKVAAFCGSMNAINLVIQYSTEFYNSHRTCDNVTNGELEEFFKKLLRINLWGNRCDLSISNGREVEQSENPFESLPTFEPCILADNSHEIWTCLIAGAKSCTVDIVLDNAGYELFTDFVLADFILHYKLANKIRFHCKAIPWFISDVLTRDFHWTIEQLACQNVMKSACFGKRLKQYIIDDRFELQPTEFFWTSPYEFQAMPKIAPNLYANLSNAHLVIFKGDLNYRKLLADLNWPFDTNFIDVLGDFRPTNLCTLRTVKADIICELSSKKANELFNLDHMWMETGKYGVLHFAPKV